MAVWPAILANETLSATKLVSISFLIRVLQISGKEGQSAIRSRFHHNERRLIWISSSISQQNLDFFLSPYALDSSDRAVSLLVRSPLSRWLAWIDSSQFLADWVKIEISR